MATSSSLEATTLMERDQTIQQLQSELSAMKGVSHTKNTAEAEENSVILQKLVGKDEHIDQLTKQVAALETEHDNRQSEENNELSLLREKLTEQEELARRLQDQLLHAEKAQEEVLQDKISNLEEEMQKKGMTIQTLQAELQIQQQKLEETASHQSELNQLKEHLAHKESAIQQLESQVADLKEERDQHLLEDMDATILKDRLAQKEEAVDRLEAQLLDVERELDDRKKQSCEACSDLGVQLEGIRSKYEELQQQHRQAEEKRESTKAGEFLKTRKEMAQLLRKEEQYQSKIEAQQTEIENLKAANAKGTSDHLGSSSTHSQRRRSSMQRLQSQDNCKQVLEMNWKGSSTVDAGIYTGFLNDVGNPEGTGTLKFEDGSVYDGGWKDGNLHGEGVFAWVDGDLYHGEWLEGRQHG